jgi:hypothetical protein
MAVLLNRPDELFDGVNSGKWDTKGFFVKTIFGNFIANN